MPVRHVFTSPQPDVADPTLVRPSNWNDTHAITLVEGVSLMGNTAGVLALISSGTLFLEGGNNITLSQAAGGNTILISAGVAGGGNFTAGVSTGGNTSGDTGVVTGRLVLAGGNNVTLSQATALGGLITVTVSGANQSVQTQNMMALTLSGNTSGALALVSSGTLTLAGGNNITLSQAGNAVTISGASQSTHAHSDAFNILSAGTQIAGTQQTVVFSDSNGLAFGMSNNSIITGSYSQSTHAHSDVFNRISAGTQIAGTQQTVIFSDSNGVAFGMSNNSIVTASYSQSTHAHTDAYNIIAAGTQTANTTGTVIFSNSNGIAFGMSNNSIVTASYTVPTVPAQFTGGFSTQGNTAGDTALVTGRLLLVGGANITLSGSSNAGSLTLTIIGGAGAAGNTGSISAGGVDATLGRVIFSDSNGMAFGVNGQTVTASYTQSTHTHSFLSAGMSTQGNTSGTTGLVAERLILVGGDNITLSQSVDAQSATLTISAGAGGGAAPTISHWANFGDLNVSVNINSAMNLAATANATLWLFPLDGQRIFPGNMSVSTVHILLSGSSSNQWTDAQSFRYSFGLYTRANASKLSLLYSASGSYTDQATSQSSLIMGLRWLTLGSAAFNAAPNLSQSEYFGALWMRSSGQSRGISVIAGRALGPASVFSGTFGAASTSAVSLAYRPWHGYYSVSFTTAMPTELDRTDMVLVTTAQLFPIYIPIMAFNNYAGLYG